MTTTNNFIQIKTFHFVFRMILTEGLSLSKYITLCELTFSHQYPFHDYNSKQWSTNVYVTE